MYYDSLSDAFPSLPIQLYLVDAFTYAASATGAASVSLGALTGVTMVNEL
jgi:hypothetical protein